ncbi:uncharacterized protein LOC132933034 [Metopolophium dirhodum]|uniref:uncharacterized protein LOC132933031 n=1 Tax=Metopolophium dirhodum TaxID=44670 RepID=UPI00298FACE6|nr:uncharacterized protein LOC132933031 [Metopolophium dirhodum]XP_060855353.1 uncharacterized protein LOC132933034 [Metopolophium dirhodum]
MEEWLDRYYNLRRRTGYDRPNFFVTNRGEKIVKIYDDVTKIFGQKLTASIFRKMVETSGRDHDAVTSGAIAQALQHSDRTANQYYRLPDATEALRRNKQIETVDHTALVKSYVDKNFEDLFPLEPYIKFDAEEWRAKIRDCQAFEEYPSATIDLFYVEKLGDKFYGAMYVRRSEILAEEMAIEKYTKLNYTDHAVIDMDVNDDDDEDIKPRRRTCAETLALNKDTLIVKYCPMCEFMTTSNKLGRHMSNKHSDKIRKPKKNNIKRSASWEVYGGSWDLPGVPVFANPFRDYIINVDDVDDVYVADRYSRCLPPPAAQPVPQPQPPVSATGNTPPVSQTPLVPARAEKPSTTAVPPEPSPAKCLPTVRMLAQNMGLNRQLPPNHPLIVMFANTLKMSHGDGSMAAENYVANVSRVLMHVHQHLVDTRFPPRHWSDLVSTDVKPYMEYFDKRESLGQTKATSINYLKNLRLLFNHVIHSYVHEDSTFAKGFDLSPCMATITKIKLLDQKLNLVYRKKTKQQPAELFQRMTDQAKQLPDYEDVVRCLSVIREGIESNLGELERTFTATVGTITVRSEKNSGPAEKKVNIGVVEEDDGGSGHTNPVDD